MSDLVWVQTVCKGYQLTTKIVICKKRVNPYPAKEFAYNACDDYCAVTAAGNMGTTKPVQICAGFILCTAEVIIHLHHNYYIASESETMPCIQIDKPLVVYRLSGNVCNDAFNVTHVAKT